MNIEFAKKHLPNKLSDVQEVSKNVLRGIRRKDHHDISIYYFDFNGEISHIAENLDIYQDDLLGQTYFDTNLNSDLRWNHYLYMISDEKSVTSKLSDSIRKIQNDPSYARKFVITSNELENVISKIDSLPKKNNNNVGNILEVWTNKLISGGLDSVLDIEKTLANTIRIISTGKSKNTTRMRKTSGEGDADKLSSKFIRELDLTGYRTIPSRKKFTNLGRANLIFGTNGVGKTSLLESIELLFCGNNRRSPGTGLSVTAVLEDKTKVTTGQSQKLSDFDTRLRAWYGGENSSNANKLMTSFSRFNFLNTDAASELTLVANGVTVKSNLDSLADLVSGPGTSALWKRLTDVQKGLITSRKELETNHRFRLSELQSVVTELAQLRQGPDDIDADYEILLRQLERLNWKILPKERTAIDFTLSSTLSQVAAQLGAVKRLSDIGTVYTLGAIANRRELLISCMDEASDELRQQDERQRVKKSNLAQLSKIEMLKKELGKIDLELLRKYLDAETAYKIASSELEKFPTVLVDAIVNSENVVIPNDWQEKILSDVLQLIIDERATSERELIRLSLELNNAQKRNTRQIELRVQIRNLALQMFSHGHSERLCPLCETSFESGELLSRLQTEIIDNEQEILQKITFSKSAIEEKITTLGNLAIFVNNLKRFVDFLNLDSSAISVLQISTQFQQFKATGMLLTSRVEELRSEWLSYRNAGIDPASITSLCWSAKPDFSTEQLSAELVEKAIALVDAEHSLTRSKTEEDVLDSLSEDSSAVAALVAKAGLHGAGLTTWMEFISTARELISTYSLLIESVNSLQTDLELTKETDLQEVYALLYECISLADAVAKAVQYERTASAESIRLSQVEVERKNQLLELSQSIEKVTAALVVIGDIVTNHSMEGASEQAITATHAVADEVFARIHVPAEFSITTDVEYPLKRRADETKLTLNEISTGQRAAYMLSMFLAMNAQVSDGPKVLMLDDPIAHIDDLNALSFLDYLRDLVLTGERQIFFATADEKIAGLFAHKFAFLGDEFRTIQLAR
jgi:energy-coupling factor transporter ATP-binding protein EcfA2